MSDRTIVAVVCASLGLSCMTHAPARALWDVPPVVNCTTSYGLAVFDIAVAAPVYIGLAYGNGTGAFNFGPSKDPNVNVAAHVAVAVISVLGGIYVAQKVKQCRNYKAYVADHEPLPVTPP